MALTAVREARNPSILGLVSHLQTVTEREKAGLARALHDELGGLLVAASMDLAWLEREIATAEIGAAAKSPGSAELHRRLGRSTRSVIVLRRSRVE